MYRSLKSLPSRVLVDRIPFMNKSSVEENYSLGSKNYPFSKIMETKSKRL